MSYSSFKENDGNNGIFIIAYTPLLFGGTTQFIGNNGSDALRVAIIIIPIPFVLHYDIACR